MKKLNSPSEVELTVEKSRFLGYCIPITSEEEVDNHIKAMKKVHYKADHVCSAWRVGYKRTIGHFSDDGEPSQTAGLPMYQYLEHHQLTGVLVLAVRYFGGIKLGTGGLVRAYTDTVKSAVRAAQWVEVISCQRVEVRYPYTYQKLVMIEMQKELQSPPEYSTVITQVFYVRDVNSIEKLNDKLHGQLEKMSTKEVYVGIGAMGIEEIGGVE